MIQAASAGFDAGDFAYITINDIQVPVKMNTNQTYRGLHIVIINGFNGNVDVAQVFDTYKSSEEFEEFIDDGEIPGGFIIIAVCRDDCAQNLSDKARAWFEALGSKLISTLKYRQSFAFIGT